MAKKAVTNEYKMLGDTCLLRVTTTAGAAFNVLFDAVYLDRVREFNWTVKTTPTSRAVVTVSRDPVTREPVTYSLSYFFVNPPDGSVVFFKNGDPLDCRKGNLEIISRKEAGKRRQAGVKRTQEVV
jgi:hypothetical protein